MNMPTKLIAIYTHDMRIGVRFLEQYRHYLPYEYNEVVRWSKYQLLTTDGKFNVQVLKADNLTKGVRFFKAFVNVNIREEVFDSVIAPAMTHADSVIAWFDNSLSLYV